MVNTSEPEAGWIPTGAPLPQALVNGGIRRRWPACSRVDCWRPGLTSSRSAMLQKKRVELVRSVMGPQWDPGRTEAGDNLGQAAAQARQAAPRPAQCPPDAKDGSHAKHKVSRLDCNRRGYTA